MADGPAKAPTAPTELTNAMAAPAAFPDRRLAARLQNIGSPARIPIADIQNPEAASGAECARPAITKPAAPTRKSHGSVRKLRLRLAHHSASAPKPNVIVPHQPVAMVDAPCDVRIFGSQKVSP